MAAAAQVRVAVVAHDCILTRRAQALPLNAVIVERRDAPVLLDCSNDRELAIGRVQLIKTARRSSSVSLLNHHPLPSVLADLPWSASFKTLPFSRSVDFLLAQRREPVSPRWRPDPSARPFTPHRPTQNHPIAPGMLVAISQPLFHPSAASSPAIAPTPPLTPSALQLLLSLPLPAALAAAPATANSASATPAPLPAVSKLRLAPPAPHPCSKTPEKRRPAPYSTERLEIRATADQSALSLLSARAPVPVPPPAPLSKDAPLRAQSGVSKRNGRAPTEPTDERPKTRARAQTHSAAVLGDIWNLVDDGERARAEKAARRARRGGGEDAGGD
ncbi:hypothetical protein B0H14DRAFT_3867703 [Mycena olivaceomarginata]|nr:hypothetical protein B0H14DRAFT_3867703 [Mycena olivaceomarginata]